MQRSRFDMFSNYSSDNHVIPDNRPNGFSCDYDGACFVCGATNMLIAGIQGLGKSDVKSAEFLVHSGIELVFTKTEADLSIFSVDGCLYFQYEMPAEESAIISYAHDLQTQVKIILIDDTTIYTPIVKYRVHPSLG